MSQLLIVESPAKCSKIQGFLGSGWRVIATMGHIRSLEEGLDAVGLDRDFEPRYAFLKEKSKAIQQLKACAKEASKVFLASDDDREGEAISYSVAVLLGLPIETTPRIVFHEITKDAITNALRNPKTINMNRAYAQQARAILDMMVGFTISPLLWKFVGGGLSAGRCQTPALRLVVDRETEITDFKSETTWAVTGSWLNGKSSFEASLVDPIDDEESASNYLENIHDDAAGTVTDTNQRETSQSAPKPLITSTLQQEASALYGSQPKSTMQTAQRLYEAGYITYMRTDNPVLSADAVTQAQAFVRTNYGESYLGKPAPAKKKVKEAPVQAQEAHEAIRPTHLDKTELPTEEDWSAMDRKIYKLIWNRTVQSVMADCKGEERTVYFTAAGCEELPWKAVWARTLFQGWKRVAQPLANLDDDADADQTALGAWTTGQELKIGSTLAWTALNAAPKETKAHGRYTEATLVRELERRGIGRPSTFASLVSTILDKEYVVKRDTPAKEVKIPSMKLGFVGQWPPTRVDTVKKVGAEKQKLAPSPLGKSALEFCTREFDMLFAYGFTKQMEERLDKISEGKEEWRGLCRDTWASFKDHYEELKAQKGGQVQTARTMVFDSGIKAVQSKKGPILLIEGVNKDDTVFYGWPDGVSFSEMTAEIAQKHVHSRQSESLGLSADGQPIICKSGPFGKYVVCGSTNIPWKDGDTVETIRDRIKEKSESVLHRLGEFEFRRGPYGVYMFKKEAKKKQFVSVPAGVDPKNLTGEAAIKMFQTGLQQKAKAKTYGGSKK